jgi:diguanylate cyclase
MSDPRPDDLNYWKNKYSTLVKEFEGVKEDADQKEKLLCRSIIRLTLATSGLDAALDPHLAQIRDLLRKGISSDKLLAELNAVSETLLRQAKKGENGNGAALKRDSVILFRFLKTIALGHGEREALTALERRVDEGEIGDADLLFSELQGIMKRHVPSAEDQADAGESLKSGLFSRLLGRGAAENKVDAHLVRDRLIVLLDAIELPVCFQDQARAIRTRLQAESRSETLQGLLNDAITLLGEVKTYMQREQKEIESFLEILTGKLGELEQQAVGVDANTQTFLLDREANHSSFSSQFEEFKTKAAATTELGQLKSLVSSRLESLTDQLKANREREMARLRETQQQIGQLTARLHTMEQESTDLRSKLRMAHDLALRDALTGLPNRKAYQERLDQEMTRWRRFGHSLSLAVWDVDHFKGINDRYGHAAGDKVLVTVAHELAASIRETDLVARYGGEEFVMILCGADRNAALTVANQIRERIGQCGFNSQGKPVAVTISCGIAEFRNGDTPQTIFERADQALYEAKQNGRNRCMVG